MKKITERPIVKILIKILMFAYVFMRDKIR